MVEDDRPRQALLGSIRVRITATVVLLLVASSIMSKLVLREVLFRRLEEEVAASLRQEAQEFRLLSAGNDPRTGAPFGDDFQAVFDVYFEREVPDEGESLLAFVDGELYRSKRAQDAAAVGDIADAINHWLSLDEAEEGCLDTALGEARYAAMPLGGQDGQALFVVANFPAYERSEIDEAVRAQTLAQLAAVALASLLGLALAGRVLRPLRSLADTARTISDTDLTRRIQVHRTDEASQIATTFNDMLARLDSAFATQRRFLDDASHELRTPLTVIRGHVELLELDTDPDERRATTTLITDEIDRMNRIVNDLLLLASADQPDLLRPELDLHDLLTAIHRKVTVLADRDWVLEAPPPAPSPATRSD